MEEGRGARGGGGGADVAEPSAEPVTATTEPARARAEQGDRARGKPTQTGAGTRAAPGMGGFGGGAVCVVCDVVCGRQETRGCVHDVLGGCGCSGCLQGLHLGRVGCGHFPGLQAAGDSRGKGRGHSWGRWHEQKACGAGGVATQEDTAARPGHASGRTRIRLPRTTAAPPTPTCLGTARIASCGWVGEGTLKRGGGVHLPEPPPEQALPSLQPRQPRRFACGVAHKTSTTKHTHLQVE
jgi:hypothetical protein